MYLTQGQCNGRKHPWFFIGHDSAAIRTIKLVQCSTVRNKVLRTEGVFRVPVNPRTGITQTRKITSPTPGLDQIELGVRLNDETSV